MLESVNMETIIYYVLIIVVMLVSLTAHEYAHARASYKQWDPTPVLQWRLSLNPFRHIDIIWFICVFLIGFWWAKPVVVNPLYYKNPKKWEILTAFAGPAMNLVLAFLWMLILMIYAKIMWIWVQDLLMMDGDLVVLFRQILIIINISLAVFNMIPMYPLDWYRLIKIFRDKWAQRMEKNWKRIYLVFILLIVSWSPIISGYISTVSDIIYRLFFMLFSLIFY